MLNFKFMFENIMNFLYYHLIQKVYRIEKNNAVNEDHRKILGEIGENKNSLNFSIQQLISDYFSNN